MWQVLTAKKWSPTHCLLCRVNPFAVFSNIDKDAAEVLTAAWLKLAKEVRAKGKPANTDFSIAACLARIVDLKTGSTSRGLHISEKRE